jgi:hypothetical protein
MEIKGSLENALSEIDALRSKMSELSKRNDIHQIELDLLLQKLRELYDFLSSLQYVQETEAAAEPVMSKAQRTVKKTDKVEHSGDLTESFEINIDQPGNAMMNNNPVESHIPIEQEQARHKQTAEKTEPKHEQKPEKHGDSKKSVHELLSESAQKKTSHIGTVLQTKPLHNIEDAIGVNDKFLFIRELFSSNTSRYKETIDALNNASDFNSAYSYIEKNFQWDSENEATQKLLELVRRRHISHKNG